MQLSLPLGLFPSRFPMDGDDDLNEKTRLIFNNTDSFRVYHISDVSGCEASGALKNVVAIGAGFVDGLGMGSNTKAALMRIGEAPVKAVAKNDWPLCNSRLTRSPRLAPPRPAGILEMERFCNDFLHGVEAATFQESCGMADLITTCVGGRNRMCGEIFARQRREGGEPTWDKIEADNLNGQRLRGVKTAKQVHDLLASKDLLRLYPLFSTIYEIAYEGEICESRSDELKKRVWDTSTSSASTSVRDVSPAKAKTISNAINTTSHATRFACFRGYCGEHHRRFVYPKRSDSEKKKQEYNHSTGT